MANEFSEFISLVAKRAETLAKSRAIHYASSTRVKRSIKSAIQQKGQFTHKIIVSANGKIAVFRELGTKAHPIVPRNHSVLVFPWDKAADYIPRTKDGRVILKKVNHPGSKADNDDQGYLRPAGRDTVKFIKDEFRGKVKASIKAELVAHVRGR